MEINDKVYNTLKYVAQYALPALATFVMSFGQIWNVPYADQISLTLMAVDTALGVMLGISSNQYYKKIEKSE